MQTINSSFSNVALGTSNNVPVNPAQLKNKVNAITGKQVSEKQDKPVKSEQFSNSSKQVEQNEAKPAQQKQSFKLDEATIAFLESNQQQNYQEKNYQEQGQLVQKNDSIANFSSVNESIDKDIIKESVSSQNKTAVSSYQQIDNLAQRESVQQLLGIDLYA
jgi:hypothetical protein